MSAPDDESPENDKKVRDLVRPPGAEEGARLDEDQIAQIVHWFGLPSIDSLGEAQIPEDPAASASEAERTLAKRAAVAAHVDRAMIDRVEQHTRDGDVIRQLRDEPERPWENARFLQLHEDLIPAVPADDDWPEVSIPDQLRRDLRIRTPQAQLRDLHRPEKEFGIHYQPPWDDDFVPPPADPLAPVREALRSRVDAIGERQGVRAAAPTFAGLREVLARPWQDAKRAHAREREAELLAEDAGKSPEGRSVEREPEKTP